MTLNISVPALGRQNAMLKFGLELHGQYLPKSILRSPKVKLNFEIRLFNAPCISILLNGCESWILTEALIDKLQIDMKLIDIFTRIYRIILDIKQSRDHGYGI